MVDTRRGRVRQRPSRRTATGQVDLPEAYVRERRVAQDLPPWYNTSVGPSLVASGRLGTGRRLHLVDCTKVAVPFNSGQYAWSGVVRNENDSVSRGYTRATIRTLVDTAGVVTQAAVAPMQDHDLAVCRGLLSKSRVFRAGVLRLEDNGCMDGELISERKTKRQVDVIVPLRSNMVAFGEAVRLAQCAAELQSLSSLYQYACRFTLCQ